MKALFSILSALLIILLVLSGLIGMHSKKKIGKRIAFLNFSLLFPMIGSLLTGNTQIESLAMLGGYLYFMGMNQVLVALILFAAEYCKNSGTGHKPPKLLYILLGLDTLQLALNPIFHHAFGIEKIILHDAYVYKTVPYLGQMIHRIVDYLIFFGIILVFAAMVIRMPKIYKERYSVITGTMLFAGFWQGSCIWVKSLVDHATLGFGISGIIMFYFAMYYRPLKLLDSLLSNIVSELPEALFIFDPNGKCIWANAPGCQLADLHDEIFEPAEQNLIQLFGEGITHHDNWHTKVNINAQNYYVIESHVVKDKKNHFTGSYLRIRDVTRDQQEIQKNIYEATHDSLTGLYTREYLYQRIAELFQADKNQQYLIVYVDVKNFKIVNDIFGNEFGDYALQCIAEWVRSDMSDDCRYGRLVGDTFGVCVPEAEFHQEELEKELSSFIIEKDGNHHQLLIHLGVYRVESTDHDVSVMFDRAHLALSTIQEEYKQHIAFYDKAIREKILWNQSISAQLADAINQRQVCPYLQPIADRSGKIVGAEALARWIHPEHGFMSPALFIPVFEQNGMIAEVDKHIWRCACEILSRWNAENRDLFIAVNISPKDFYFMDVLEEIKNLVKEFSISPEKIRIEITETVMMNEADNRMKIMESFRNAGFIVEMDDFGSGYSSLNLLKDMPVDVLKIDMKFLGNTGDKVKARTIVKNIIHLSEELGISALTEGVETQEQYQALVEMGCSLFQGYYFSKPIPETDFEKLL